MSIYLFITLLFVFKVHTESKIDSIQFTNESYTGYVSENIGQLNPSQLYPSEPSKRHYQTFDVNKKSVYVRFIDQLKPSVQFVVSNTYKCLTFNFKTLNLSLKTDDYDQDAISLFEIDYDNYLCTKINLKCVCYFQIRLTDDPFVRDRINREAKDKYKLELFINNTKASLIVNILDDNDLEPMFDPSEYSIELNQFEVNSHGQFQIINLPEYSVIGQVKALDPDLAENARIKYYSKTNPYFGVFPNTGEIFLKKSSSYLFALNLSEISLQVKAFDAGIKLNLINNLARLNASLLDNLDDRETLDRRLVDMVTNLDQDKISLVSKYLDQVKSFELAQVNVVLKKNLLNLFEKYFSYPTIEKILPKTKPLNNRLIPLRVLKFSKILEHLNELRIMGDHSHMFEFELSQDRQIFISLFFDPNLIRNETKQYKIMFCIDQVCVDLIEFEINFLIDINHSMSSICELSLALPQTAMFKVNKMTRPGSPLFDARPALGSSNICDWLGSLVHYELTINNNSKQLVTVGPFFQVLVNQVNSQNQVYELIVAARLKNLDPFVKKHVQFSISYSDVYDFLSFSFNYNKEFNTDPKRFGSNVLYLSLKSKKGAYKTNADYDQLNRSTFVQDYLEAFLILGPNLRRILIANSFVNEVVRLKVNNEQSPSQNLLGVFSQPIGNFNITVHTTDPLDSKCFYVDHFYGSLYLKCQLLPSLSVEQKLLSTQIYRRQIDLFNNNTELLTSIQLEFSIEHDLENFQNLSIQIEPVKIKFVNVTSIDRHLQTNEISEKMNIYVQKTLGSFKKQTNNLVKKILNNESPIRFEYKIKYLKDCYLNTELFQIETNRSDVVTFFNLIDPSGLFYIDYVTGVLKFKSDFRPKYWLEKHSFRLKLELLETNFLKNFSRQYELEITLKPEIAFDSDLVQIPKLIRKKYELIINESSMEKSNDLLLINSFDVFPHEHQFNVSYSLLSDRDVPFYLDSNGKLFYFNTHLHAQGHFKFQVNLKFKFYLNESVNYEETAFVSVHLSSTSVKMEFFSEKQEPVLNFNLNVPMHTSDYVQLEKSTIIGFVTLTDSQIYKHFFDIDHPVFVYNRPNILFINHEQNLLNENFLKLIQIDEQTGAIYFNPEQLNSINLYNRLSKLVDYFYYVKKLDSKIIDFEVTAKNVYTSVSIKLKVNLIFHLNSKPVWIPNSVDALSKINKFRINTNNLLNLFRNGDEFLLGLDIEENAPTWPAYLEYHRTDQEGFIINLRDYFKAKLNSDSKTTLINHNLLKNTRFYIQNDPLFQIVDNYNGLIQTKHSIQFDYEIEQSYMAKILIIQYRDSIDVKSNQENDLIFKSEPSHFTYYLDMAIKVVNIVDEPFITSEPVYYISVDENEAKNKKLFTIKLLDFDRGVQLVEPRLKAEIYSGNTQGHFYMSGLTLYTSASPRKLNREIQSKHELQIKIVEYNQETNSSRYALCRLVVNVEDINDHRPIVNDIELDIYDQIDAFLAKKVPIANAISIDQDSISELKYLIMSVRILPATLSDKSFRKVQLLNLKSLFVLNTTSGALSINQPDFPCHSCSIQITYRALDIGRFKNRTSRKSYIKLNILPKPIKNASTFELSLTPEKTDKIIVLNLNEDVKLGEKVYQVKTNFLSTIQKSIIYYNLLEESNENLTFYMSNHDGSLYLIKKLDADNGIQFYNLSVLITNWQGQIEYVFIEVYVKDTNDNRPEFSSNLVYLNESIQVEANVETSIDLIEAMDPDEIDQHKLQFKMEDCFYLSQDILLKKPFIPSAGINPSTNHLNYPLCSKQFLALVPSPSSGKSQLVKLKINTIELRNYLETSSDMFNKIKGSIFFVLDLSVQDTSSDLPTLTRIMLNLTIEKQSTLIFKRQLLQDSAENQDDELIDFGFRRKDYIIIIKNNQQLTSGTKLIGLFNEFVWTRGEQIFAFKPYEISFSLTKSDGLFSIDKNFGLLSLNSSLTDLSKIYQVEIEAQVNKSCLEKSKFYKKTKILVSILKSAIKESDQIGLKISSSALIGYIDENVPIGSHVLNKPSGEQFDLFSALNLNPAIYSIKLNDRNFYLESDSGSIRTKTELDYEIQTNYFIKFEICSINNAQCVNNLFEIEIKVNNLNDNEPLINALSCSNLILKQSDLIPSMSLCTFSVQDMDKNLTAIDMKIYQKSFISANCSDQNNMDVVELFSKFDNKNMYGLKLGDMGYEFLLYVFSQRQCSARIQVLMQANDGLFMSWSNFSFTLQGEENLPSLARIKSNPIVPILHTIELIEGHAKKSEILNLELVLENYLKSQKYSKKTQFLFNLLNFEDLFYIQNGRLYLGSDKELDREYRETYELFIAVESINKLSVPRNIRVLVKINDVNDNRPVFVQPFESVYTRTIFDLFDLYEYNASCLKSKFLSSTESDPIFSIKAKDDDLAQNGSIFYTVKSNFNGLVINSQTGSLFYTGKNQHVPSLIEFNITARDQGSPHQESMLKVRLSVLKSNKNVYFKTNFYSFKMNVNDKANATVGYVNSAALYDQVDYRLIYSIREGDDLQQFYLNPLNGRLSLRKEFKSEEKTLYRLLIEAKSELQEFGKCNIWVHVQIEGFLVPRLEFEKFEYHAHIDENKSKMSEIIKLKTSDPNANFKLLNNYDLFYINELTGSVFNKQMFDFESEEKEFYVKVKAYNMLYETYCVLVVKIFNQNDNRPEFDKNMYFSEIELSMDSTHSGPLEQILMNNSYNMASNLTHQFVTKIVANDPDLNLIEYDIISQNLLVDTLENKNLIESTMFYIDTSRGFIYLNKNEFLKFKKIFNFLNSQIDSDKIGFSLKISANDSRFIATTQLHIHIKQLEFTRPEFKSDRIKFNFDYDKYLSKSKLIDLGEHLKEASTKIELKTWTRGFGISNGWLWIDKEAIHNISNTLDVGVFACDRIQTGLCDQTLIQLNATSSLAQTQRAVQGPVFGFVSQYGVYSIQQQFSAADYNYMDFVNEYDYYIYEELNDANERFYYELKAFELSENLRYQFDIVECHFEMINLTISNASLIDQLKKFTQSRDKLTFTPIQIKYLFLLNKHNGVLSSRKTINSMNPGVYNFNISLRVLSKNQKNETMISPVMDYMKFRLVVLPTVSSLVKEINKNDYKFEREFYRFKFDIYNPSIGSVRLVAKFNKSLNFSAKYKLVENKFKLDNLFVYDEGELKVNKKITIDLIRPYLNENNELYLNCLCLASIQGSIVELMKEVVIDFTSFLKSEPEKFQPKNQTDLLAFTRFDEKIKIYNNLPVGTDIFRFMVKNSQNSAIVYSSENKNFNLDPNSGLLTIKSLASGRLNVTACKNEVCLHTGLDIELIDPFDRVANFDTVNQNGVIREDALPGTVVTTLIKTDKKIDYFIINGDEYNQFDISSDAKVYTRRMLDKESISNYTLTIIAFDGMFKSTIELFVNVLNVDDSRPVCHDNLVNLKLAENLPLHQVVHVPNITNSDQDSALVHQIISDFEQEILADSIPFKYNQNTKVVELSAELDYETRQFYTFYLLNSLNKLNKCMIKYVIEITDINDNRPEFFVLNRTVSVYEHSPRGLILDLDMYTSDLDSTNNSVIHYAIQNDTYFNIDKTNGIIQVNSPNLDREVIGDQIKLDIQAFNLDNLTNVYTLNVNIIDTNDNKPVFAQKEYLVYVKENLALNTEIATIKAHDPDLNSKTEYYIRSSDKFYIDSQTGSIYLNCSLDYEKESQYKLEIVASDTEMSTKDNYSSCLIIINVIDVNDNWPIFDPSTPKHVTIDENLPLNSTVMFIKANDLDKSESNNKISYQLINGSEYFQIDSQTGRLYTINAIDYEEMSVKNLNLTIECRDNGHPELKSLFTLKISVQDVNDNEPIFAHINQTFVLKDSLSIGSEITRFMASDKDSFGQLFTFSIMEQYKKVENNKIYLSEKIFFMKENSLILSKNLLSNQTYGLRIRCYDSGLPSPLYADTFVSIIVTDESNTVPLFNDTSIELTSIDHFAPITRNQVIGQLKASDTDKDTLFFELSSEKIDINQLNGLIRAKEDITDLNTLNLSPRVTDKKFVVEANLNLKVNRVKPDCLFNSLYAKFVIWHSDETKFSLENFVKMGYLRQINDYLQEMVVLKRKTMFNLSIDIIGLRLEQNLDHDIFDIGLDESLFDLRSSLIEVLFTVKKTSHKSLYSSCINSKYMSRFLSKKKPILLKKLKNQPDLTIRLKDLSYNTKCSTFDDQICSINIQLQTCRINFNGFNSYDLCDLNNACYLLPNYNWTCESNSKLEIRHEPDTFSQECAKNPCQNNGLCKIVKKMSKFKVHCFCPNGFKGKYCEQDVNECTETGVQSTQWINPCHPSANCINTQGSYICNCTLEPSSLCYNTLSPQYTASVAAFKNDKNSKYSNSLRQFKFLAEDLHSSDENELDLYDQVTMFGHRIPNHVIQQALLGIFGGICAILVLLSLAAAIMCKINFSKGYIEAYEVRHDAMTSNTSVDHDGFTSSSSSPGSFKIEAKKPAGSKYKTNRFNRSKQRSSMTASLISSNTVESSDGEQVQRKNFRYRINNLFFSKSQNLRGLPEANREESEVESSSTYSPKSIAKYDIELKSSVIESNGLLKHENDGDDEDESNRVSRGLVRPVDNYGRSSFKTKYNTLDLRKMNPQSQIDKIKFNTAIKRPKGKDLQKEHSSFLSKLANNLSENALEADKGSIVSVEDSCLGFYWDITDWAGNTEQFNDSKTFLPVNTNLEQQNSASLSPIYSRVFKINKVDNQSEEKSTQNAQLDMDALNDESLNLIGEKLNAQKTDTYMYLTREDCDKTLESIRTQTNTEEETMSNHYYAPTTFKQ